MRGGDGYPEEGSRGFRSGELCPVRQGWEGPFRRRMPCIQRALGSSGKEKKQTKEAGGKPEHGHPCPLGKDGEGRRETGFSPKDKQVGSVFIQS